MKEKKLKIIIILMTLSVIGLFSVQFYWLNNVIKVEESRFRRTVYRSLRKVSEDIEKKEAATTIVKKATGNKGNILFFIQDDSKNNNKPLYLDSLKRMRYLRLDTTTNGFKYEVKYFTDRDSLIERVKVVPPNINANIRYFMPPSMLGTVNDTVVQNRHLLVQNVVTELLAINARKKIDERISTNELETSLLNELKSNGIEVEFFFGVNKIKQGGFTLLKANTDTVELKKSDFRVNLFPDEIFFDQNQLIVYFPHQKSYILSNISGMLLLSVGLIIIIVIVFYKTVQMFLSQKKITAVKNDLINNITHEFKTPISTISLACEALNEPGLLTEKNSVTRYSKIIREENDRLKMMVDTLLNTAAMEKGDIDLNKEEMDLHKVIEQSASKFYEIIEKKNGKFIFNLELQNPNIKSDKFHITNILINLIDNAIKYNELPPEIIITTAEKDNSILISIKDNGIGIAKEHVGKIFETFFRVSNGNIQNVRGNGIGLSYAQKIVEALNGNISVSSEPGKGSEFKITFPINGNT